MLSPALLLIIALSHLSLSDQLETEHVLVYKSNNETSGRPFNNSDIVTPWWKVDRKTPNSPQLRTSTSLPALSLIKDFFHYDSEDDDHSAVFRDLTSEEHSHLEKNEDLNVELESPFLVQTQNENANILIQSPFLVTATQDDWSENLHAVDDSLDDHSDIANNNDYGNLEGIGVSSYKAVLENYVGGDEEEDGLFNKIRRILKDKINGDSFQNILQQANYPLVLFAAREQSISIGIKGRHKKQETETDNVPDQNIINQVIGPVQGKDSPPSLEQRSDLPEDADAEIPKDAVNEVSFYPQSSFWEERQVESSVTSQRDRIEVDVSVEPSQIMEKVETILQQQNKSPSFKDSADFINLLSQLNATLETLKYQEKVYKTEQDKLEKELLEAEADNEGLDDIVYVNIWNTGNNGQLELSQQKPLLKGTFDQMEKANNFSYFSDIKKAPIINHSESYYVSNFQAPTVRPVGGVGNNQLNSEEQPGRHSQENDFLQGNIHKRKPDEQHLETPGPILSIFSNSKNSQIESWPRPHYNNYHGQPVTPVTPAQFEDQRFVRQTQTPFSLRKEQELTIPTERYEQVSFLRHPVHIQNPFKENQPEISTAGYGSRLPLPGVFSSDSTFSIPFSSNIHEDANLVPLFTTTTTPTPKNLVHEEIQRLRDENMYLTSLIKTLLPKTQSTSFARPLTTVQPSQSVDIKSDQQEPVVLKLKENKNNNRFIVPIFKVNKYKEEREEMDGVRKTIQDFNLLRNDQTLETRLQGLNYLRNTPLTDQSWKYKYQFSRFKRSVPVSNEGLILQRPSVFRNINSLGSTVKPEFLIQNISNPPHHHKPSSFYQVPPSSTVSSFSVGTIGPPSNNASSVFFGSSLTQSEHVPDQTLDPLTVIQQLQQQGLQLVINDTSTSSSAATGPTSLVRPPALTPTLGTVSSQSLPAFSISLPSAISSSSSTVTTSNRNTLTGTNAVLVAFGLSLIPTLAVSIPFFIRSRRFGKSLQTSKLEIEDKIVVHLHKHKN